MSNWNAGGERIRRQRSLDERARVVVLAVHGLPKEGIAESEFCLRDCGSYVSFEHHCGQQPIVPAVTRTEPEPPDARRLRNKSRIALGKQKPCIAHLWNDPVVRHMSFTFPVSACEPPHIEWCSARWLGQATRTRDTRPRPVYPNIPRPP